MTDETAFQAGLNESPANHDLRLVFADWLEEHADWRAAGYRWMGRHRKSPQYYVHMSDDPPDWNWRSAGRGDMAAFEVADLFPLIEGHRRHGAGWKEFATRQEAEEALCRAILQWGES